MPAAPSSSTRLASHRSAIVSAAAALIGENGSVQLNADVLAARAGVSRRSVFNHFATLDDVVTEVVAGQIGAAVDTIQEAVQRARGAERLDDAFAHLASIFRDVDLTPQLASLWSVMSVDDTLPRRYAHLIDDAFQRLSDLLLASALDRADATAADTFALELLVTSVMAGTALAARHWCEATHGAVDDRSRALWSSLVEQVTDQLGRGYHPSTS